MAISKQHSRGTALLAVLWLTAALSAIAFSVADSVRAETERGIGAQESTRAYYLARGGMERVLFEIRNPTGDSSAPTDRFRARRRFYFQEAGGDVLVELISENGKLPLRALTPQILARLLTVFGETPNSAINIAQQVFSPFPATLTTFGQNSLNAPTFRPAFASMENVEELLLVPGMTPELIYGRYNRLPDGRLINSGGLIDCVSPYLEKPATLDFYSVHPSLLEALGTPAELARQIVDLRRQNFNPLLGLNSLLQASVTLPVPVGAELGDIFSIRATARVRYPNGRLSETRRTVSLLIKYVTPNYRYLWISPWTHLRWFDQTFSDVAASSAVWSDTRPQEALR